MMPECFAIMWRKGWSCVGQPEKILRKTFPDYRGRGQLWHIVLNGNGERVTVKPDCGWGEIELPPFTMAVFWGDWLAGLIDTRGGVIAAHPAGANEDTFYESLNAAPEDVVMAVLGGSDPT
jgi:hypothetical protein